MGSPCDKRVPARGGGPSRQTHQRTTGPTHSTPAAGGRLCGGMPAAGMTVVWCLVMGAGWEVDRDPDRPPANLVHIAVIGEAMDDPTWAVIKATAKSMDEQDRLAVVEALAPTTCSPRQQRELLRDLPSRGMDAACIFPTDADALRPVINELARSGFPIVMAGRDVPNSDRWAYCGPIEMEVGRAAAKACSAAIQGRPATVMVLHAGTEDLLYGNRYLGFKKESRLYASSWKVLRAVDCGRSRSEAVRLVKFESRKYARSGCWVFLDDWPLRGLPIGQRLLPEGCPIVLCNGSPRYFDRIRDGRIAAMVTYDFRASLAKAIAAARELARSGPSQHSLSETTAVVVITRNNLADHEARWAAWEKGEDWREEANGE